MEKYLSGFKFYEVIITNRLYINEITIGTYRPIETVEALFCEVKGCKADVWEIALDEIKISKELFPIFCVELNTEYFDLENIVKDLMVWRLSGMMNKEMEGMGER